MYWGNTLCVAVEDKEMTRQFMDLWAVVLLIVYLHRVMGEAPWSASSITFSLPNIQSLPTKT